MTGYDMKSALLGLGLGVIMTTFVVIGFMSFHNEGTVRTPQEINTTTVLLKDVEVGNGDGNSNEKKIEEGLVFKLNN